MARIYTSRTDMVIRCPSAWRGGEPTAQLCRQRAVCAQYGRTRRVGAVLASSDRTCHQWMGMFRHFFRVSFILDGPWYLTWRTTFLGSG